MDIIIDGQKFFGKITENNTIVIQLRSNSDIIFFAKWRKLCDDLGKKSDCVKTISYQTLTRTGEIVGAVPFLGLNEEVVEISYDSITCQWKDL